MNTNIKAAIIDIEGALCPISFVKNILVPFINAELPDYMWDHEQELLSLIDAVKSEENNPSLSVEEVVEVLLRYLEDGQENASLISLQSAICQEGFDSGDLKLELYKDALQGLNRWREQGVKLYAYSSAQVQSEQLLICHENGSEICDIFSGFFDMEAGEGTLIGSYDKIAARIEVRPDEILFISNNIEAALAAYNADMNAIVIDRDQTLPTEHGLQVESSFKTIVSEMVHA